MSCFRNTFLQEVIVEEGGLRLIIKRLYNSETEVDALGVLLELSSRETIAEKIGGTKNCIPRLVSMLNHSPPDVMEKAGELLQKLSLHTHFVVKMAESGYFRPFVARFNQGNSKDHRQIHHSFSSIPITFLCLEGGS